MCPSPPDDVGGLEVPMEHALPVHVQDTIHQLTKHMAHFIEITSRPTLLFQRGVEVAVSQRHDQQKELLGLDFGEHAGSCVCLHILS